MNQLGARLHSHAAAKWPTAAEQRHTTKKSAQNVSQAAPSTRDAPARIHIPHPSPRNTRKMARQSGRRQGANPKEAPEMPQSQKSSGQAVHNIPPLAQIVLAHNGGEASHTHKSRTPNRMPRRGNQPLGFEAGVKPTG